MLSQDFIRLALIAGTPIALASGAIGYFIVLRSQVFAGETLSHVAFTGALAAAALGLDLRFGLFAATIGVALLLAALGFYLPAERQRRASALFRQFERGRGSEDDRTRGEQSCESVGAGGG